MKTLFITIYDGAISKNVLRTDIFRFLRKKYRIVLFVPAKKLDYYKTQFSGENILFEVTPPADRPRFERYFHILALNSFHTNAVRIKILHDYEIHKNPFRTFARFALWQVGRTKLFHRLMRWIYWLAPDSSFNSFFDKYSPSGVFVPNMISNEDFRLVKAARRRGIVSIGMPKSWDNFTGKTFFNIFPDRVLVHNDAMYEQALTLFAYPKERLIKVGFPSFDIYAGKHQLLTREAFCAELGLDPRKRIILYAAGGTQLAPRDEYVLNFLIDSIAKNSDLKDVQVLVRPHPKYGFHENIVNAASYVVIDRPGVQISDKTASWEFKDADVKHLMNSIAHMDLLVSTISTLNLEGAIFDKPLVAIAFEADTKYPFADSTARYYKYEHIQEVIRTGGVSVAYSRDEFVKVIVDYLKTPELHQDGRKKLVRRMVGMVDGKAGERVANQIVMQVG